MGITNDLIVVGKNDNIYITTFMPFPDLQEGRSHDTLTGLKNLFSIALRLKRTSLYYCESNHLRNTHIQQAFNCSLLEDEKTRINSQDGF